MAYEIFSEILSVEFFDQIFDFILKEYNLTIYIVQKVFFNIFKNIKFYILRMLIILVLTKFYIYFSQLYNNYFLLNIIELFFSYFF